MLYNILQRKLVQIKLEVIENQKQDSLVQALKRPTIISISNNKAKYTLL